MRKVEKRLHICGKPESTEEILFPSEEDALAHPCLFSDLKLVGGMEDGSGSSHALPVGKESELQKLQRQHGEKMVRIQELKREIEAVKLRLEQRKSEVPNEKVEALKGLSDEYEKLREEYNTLVAERKSSEKLN